MLKNSKNFKLKDNILIDNKKLENYIQKILSLIDDKPLRNELINTPSRVANALRFFTSGYSVDVDDMVKNSLFEALSDDVILQKNIEFYSLCEHHMLPFFGRIHVAYVPDKKIIGLSKIPRIIDVFSRRLQIQERLTLEISTTIKNILNAKGVAVKIQASHFCMMMRGVQKQCSKTITQNLIGCFKTNLNINNNFKNLLFDD